MKKLKQLYHRWQTRRLRSALQKKVSYILQSVDTLVEDIKFHQQFQENPAAAANLAKSRRYLEIARSTLSKSLPECEAKFRQKAVLRFKLSVAGIK